MFLAGSAALSLSLLSLAVAEPDPKQADAPAVSGPDVVCRFEKRGKKIDFAWNVGGPATLTVGDATTVPAGACDLEPLSHYHAATATAGAHRLAPGFWAMGPRFRGDCSSSNSLGSQEELAGWGTRIRT